MLKIATSLVLTLCLMCGASGQRRRFKVHSDNQGSSEYQDRAGRYDPRSQYPTTHRPEYSTGTEYSSTRNVQPTDFPNHYSTARLVDESTPRAYVDTRYEQDPRAGAVTNQYQTEERSFQDKRSRNKYRRRPKQTYYPKVVSFYQKPTLNNGYEFKYVTADGVQRAERGYLSDKGVWTVEGSVTSIEDGNVAVVQSYVADGSGYKSSVRRFTPENYRSLEDFLPWQPVDNSFEDNKLGTGGYSTFA